MKNKHLIKVLLLFFILIMALVSSCDPGYYVAISNRTNHEREIEVYTNRDTIKVFQNIEEKEYDLGKLVKSIPVTPFAYTTVTIPPNNALWIESSIGIPHGMTNVIIENDTIFSNEFSYKRHALIARKYVYIINDSIPKVLENK